MASTHITLLSDLWELGTETGTEGKRHTIVTKKGPLLIFGRAQGPWPMPIRRAGIVLIVPKLSKVLKYHFPRFF